MEGIDWFTDRRFAITKEPITMHVQRLSGTYAVQPPAKGLLDNRRVGRLADRLLLRIA